MPLYQPLITKPVFETENESGFKPVSSNLVFDIFARLTSSSALLHRILQVLADAFVLRCLCVYAKKREREGERVRERELQNSTRQVKKIECDSWEMNVMKGINFLIPVITS